MNVYDKLEKWKDGSIRYVERYQKGTVLNGVKVGGRYKETSYTNKFGHKFYNGEKVGVWNKEPQQKIVPEIDHQQYVKGDFYRASISLNVPIHGTKAKSNYRNFTFVVIDLKENIDMHDMYDKLIEEMENKLHYKKNEFIGWFDSSFNDCDKQYPKPYNAISASETFEGTEY